EECARNGVRGPRGGMMQPQEAAEGMAEHGRLCNRQPVELVVERVEPAVEVRVVGVWKRRIRDEQASLSKPAGEPRLPVLGARALESVEEEERHGLSIALGMRYVSGLTARRRRFHAP